MQTTWKPFSNKTPLTLLLSLTFLFLFSGSVYGDDYQDAMDALDREDYKTAYKLLLPFAEQGYPYADAQLFLGILYNNGKGVLQDYKEAEKWFRLAAEQGNRQAYLFLGEMYEDGRGVPQSYKEAVRLYRLSAEKGYASAQNFMSRMYFLGQGVPQDYVLAHMWANLAASNGSKDAVVGKNFLEKQMSPSQIEEAQRMARNWKPKK